MKSKIRRNSLYLQKSIDEVHYLLPYGQMIAEFKRGIRINDTALWLFNLLEKPLSRSEIARLAVEYYGAPAEYSSEIEADINAFIDKLVSEGILIEDAGIPRENPGADTFHISMGGVAVRIICHKPLLPREFTPFFVPESGSPDINIVITTDIPPGDISGKLLIRYEELMVLKERGKYTLFFPKARGVLQARLSESGSSCVFYISGEKSRESMYDLFRSIRVPVLFRAALAGNLAIHSSSVFYRDRVWIFAAHSGVGKSYHTSLWKKYYKTPIINGDTNILGFNPTHEEPVVYGSPWCGTSRVCTPGSFTPGGIILLKQDTRDYVEELSESEKNLLVLQRVISPSWEESALSANLALVNELTSRLPVWRLHCTKSRKAVEVIKSQIDSTY